MAEPVTRDDNGLPRAEITRRIEWIDTDAAGHQHNSVVWRLVEAAEAELFRRLDLLTDYFMCAPRVRQEANFEQKLYFGQLATAQVQITAVGRTSMSFDFEVWGQAMAGRPRRRSAVGSFVTVHVPTGTEAAAPWPISLRRAIVG